MKNPNLQAKCTKEKATKTKRMTNRGRLFGLPGTRGRSTSGSVFRMSSMLGTTAFLGSHRVAGKKLFQTKGLTWMVSKCVPGHRDEETRVSDDSPVNGFNHGFNLVRNGFCPSTVPPALNKTHEASGLSSDPLLKVENF